MLVGLWPSALHHSATWSSFSGQVLLHAAFRQPSSLWNCISNILFRALLGRISVAHSYHSSIAASQDSKWSQEPRSQPPFFLFIDKPPSSGSKSCLCVTLRPGQVSEEQSGQKQSSRAASSVSSGPAFQLTPRWSHHHHFKFPAPFCPSRAPRCMWVSCYSYLLYKYMVKPASIHRQQSYTHWQTFISTQ